MIQKILLFWVVDIIILVCLLDHKFKQNELLGKVSVFIFCQLHNFCVGFVTYMIWIFSLFGCARILDKINSSVFEDVHTPAKIVVVLILLPLLLPLNYFSKKKMKMNLLVYIITVIMAFTLGIVIFRLN